MNKRTRPQGTYVQTLVSTDKSKAKVELVRVKDGTTFFISYDQSKKRFPKTSSVGATYFDDDCLKREQQTEGKDYYDKLDVEMKPDTKVVQTGEQKASTPLQAAEHIRKVGCTPLDFAVSLQIELAALNAAVVSTVSTGLEIDILWPMYADKIELKALERVHKAEKMLAAMEEFK